MNENVQPLTTKSVGIKYGLILGIVSIISFLLITLTNTDMNGPAKWASYPIYIVIIILAHKAFKDDGSGFMSYGQGIGIAFWMSLISSLIGSVFTYIYVKFIDTGFIDTLKESQVRQMEKNGLTDAQIDQAMSISGKLMTPELIAVFGIVFGIIGIVITALIVTIFTQKKPQEQTF